MEPHRVIPLVLAWTRAAFCIAATSLLVGCAVFVNKPDAGTIATALPVLVNVTANATWSNLKVRLTDPTNSTADITPLFTYGPGQNEANASLTNLGNGNYTIVASADVYCWYCGGSSNSTSSTRSFSVNVTAPPPPAPTLTSLTPTSGPVGTSVALAGTGFAAGMSVQFGTATSAPPAVSSATSATAVVPATLSAGAVNVSVKVGAQMSGSRSFTITAMPPPTVEVFRASGTDIQRVSLTAPT